MQNFIAARAVRGLLIGCLLAAPASAQLRITTTSVADAWVSVAYNQALAAAGATSALTWSLAAGALPAGLSLSSAGVIAGTPTTAGTDPFTVQAKEKGAMAMQALSITVNPALSIGSATLPNATLGQSYLQVLSALGGLAPFQWSVSSGSLPAGLSLSSSGSLTGTPTSSGSSTFTVQVKDANLSVITQQYTLTVVAAAVNISTTSVPAGAVGDPYSQTLSATGGSGPYTWTVSAGNLPAGITLSTGGVISGTPTAAGTSNFTVKATSGGSSDTQALSIAVGPALAVTTSSLPGATVGTAYSQTLAATGGVGGNSWKVSAGSLPTGLSLSGGGSITGTPTGAGTSSFTAQVADSAGGKATAALTIATTAPLAVTTSTLPNATVGISYAQTLAASGGSGGYSWTVSAGSLPAGLSLGAGGNLTGTPTTAGSSSFTAQVTDSSGAKATAALTLAVGTGLTITTSALPAGAVGSSYSQTLAASGGSGGYTWTVSAGKLPAGLSLSAGGNLTGTPTTTGTSNFTLQVADSSGAKATAALSIVVNAALGVTTSSLPNGVVGTAYSQTVAASGGTGGYTWVVSVGVLPAGLSMSTGGVIAGTPTTAGTSNFTAQVTDSSGAKATGSLSIAVSGALAVTTSSLPNGTIGTAYSQTVAASGGTGGYTWVVSVGVLPVGLSMSTGGVIAGTPTTAGTSNFTAQVTDSSGTKATGSLTITIVGTALAVTTSSLPGGTVGAAYSQTLAASGGSGGYAWTVSAGSLPAGLSLSGAGAITGTPTTAGTANFTAQVTDSSGAKATAALSIAIGTGLSVTTASLPGGTVGTAYSQTLAATGGSGGYAWTVSAGSLPAGLSLSGAGAITGTPTTAGTANFTAQVTDSSGAKATAALSIAIGTGLSVTTASLPGGTVGTAYSITLAASGGSGGYAWTVSAGALPAGLSLSGAGAITGTPTTAGTANFTAQVTDSSGAKATAALTLAIGGVLSITTSSLPAASVGNSYQQPLAATGGSGGYAWTVSSGTLPAGLTLGAAGSITGTPTSAGTSTFTVQVTDSSGSKVTAPLSIQVGAAVSITTSSLPNAVVATAYQQSLAATGGTGSYNWVVALGSLPQGLTLSNTGAITGTPTAAGSSTFTAEVSDTSGAKADAAFTITVNPALTITTAQGLATGSAGSAYTQTFTAAGGVTPYTWQITGTLPAGLSLAAATGVLSGTPTQVGTFPITVKVSDKAGAQASANYSLQVVSGLAITTAPVLPTAEIGVAYSTTVQAIGGSSPYQYTVSAGALPAGLNFSGTGQISGTATSSGNFTFTVQATDANSNQATKQFTLTVAGALAITSTSLPAGSTQAAYDQTLTASGGQPPYSWTVSSGSLPGGLTLQTTTGALVGTPSATGSFTFTITVTDSSGATAQSQFTLAIGAGLTVTSPTALPDGVAGAPYAATLQASGGQSPYSWTVTQGALPGGLSLNAASGQIGGTPSTSGTYNFTVQVTDAAKSSVTQVETIVVGIPNVPTISISGFSGAMQPLQQPPVSVSLAAPFPVDISGTLSLSFTPSGSNPVDDPSIQFSTGGRSATFTIPANASQAIFGAPQFAVQTGSVQGTITITIVSLQAGGASLTIPSGSAQTAQVGAAPPIIESMSLVHTANGVQLQIVGAADTRDLTQLSVTFQPTAGATLQNSQFTIPLTDASAAWFQGSSSATYGGQFNLTVPFSFSGTVSLSSVSAMLTSSAGNSAAASANY